MLKASISTPKINEIATVRIAQSLANPIAAVRQLYWGEFIRSSVFIIGSHRKVEDNKDRILHQNNLTQVRIAGLSQKLLVPKQYQLQEEIRLLRNLQIQTNH